jgi:phytoene dehydrogenase-like protein
LDALQFVILFKAIFLEGLARPFAGIRGVLRLLTDRLRASGGERRMKTGVARLRPQDGRIAALELDSGEEVTADWIFSSAGAVETRRLCGDRSPAAEEARVGRLSFVETIQVLNCAPADFGWNDTIVFFNDASELRYARPVEAVDPHSGVICFPNNFEADGRTLPEGLVRMTCLANFDRWAGLAEADYRAAKAHWFRAITASAGRFLPPVTGEAAARATVATDMFTPVTVQRFTGHLGGAIYGAAEKIRDGRTPFQNLILIGTDQGYLGIVGALLSGITMANLHVLHAR